MMNSFSKLQSEYPLRGRAQVLRSLGKTQYEKLGLPTRKQEDWHYTSLKEVSSLELKLAVLEHHGIVAREDLRHDNPEFFNLIFVNGKFDRLLSDLDALSKEVSVEEVATSTKQIDLSVAQELSALQALNLSYFQQGLVIEVPAECSVSRPVQVINVLTSSNLMCHPRLIVRLGGGSKMSLIESYSSHRGQSLQNSVTEIQIGRSASLEYLRVQDEHRGASNTGHTRVELFENASLEALSFAVGGKLGRHDLQVVMLGAQSSARVQGLTLGSGQQHLDHNTLIDHAVGGCSTSQLYKSVLNHQARSVFTGMVKIRQGSQKASSEQLNNNLLLSREAEADSRPQLEILADDVKATHGSTVGQLNAEELFYLLSRAIPKEQALEMLSLGFVQDLVLQVSNTSIREWLKEILIKCYRETMREA